MNRYFLLSEILVEKNGERQIDEKKIDDYKWNFDKEQNLCRKRIKIGCFDDYQ